MFDTGYALAESILFAERKPGRTKVFGVATAMDRDGTKTLAAVRKALAQEPFGGMHVSTTLTVIMEIVYDEKGYLIGR